MLDDADTESDGIKEFLSGMKFAAAVQCFQIVRILTYCRHWPAIKVDSLADTTGEMRQNTLFRKEILDFSREGPRQGHWAHLFPGP